MSALLTDEAVRALAREWFDSAQRHGGDEELVARDLLAAALRFHANEGRQALVEAVFQALRNDCAATIRTNAEAVVTALVGDGGQ